MQRFWDMWIVGKGLLQDPLGCPWRWQVRQKQRPAGQDPCRQVLPVPAGRPAGPRRGPGPGLPGPGEQGLRLPGIPQPSGLLRKHHKKDGEQPGNVFKICPGQPLKGQRAVPDTTFLVGTSNKDGTEPKRSLGKLTFLFFKLL